MTIIFITGLMFVIALLLNEYYFHIVLKDQQEHKILKGLKGKFDRMAFGSSYGLFGISFPKEVNGFNFCLGGQFLYYTDKMLREYAPKCLNPGGIVYLVIADLVFAKVGKGIYNSERYPLILSKKSLGDEYSITNYLQMRFPLFFNHHHIKNLVRVLIKGFDNSFDTLTENTLSYKETQVQARKRCSSWCRQFHLNNTYSEEIPSDLEETFAKTRAILTGMIQFCLDEGYRPILVVTPVSQAMNDQLSDAFVEKILYSNIRKANKQGVPFLDYLRSQDFSDYKLYHNNSDFLNAKGRFLYTNKLIFDTEYL